MKWQVTTKNPLYSGYTEGVFFQHGQAIVGDELIRNLLVLEYGYSAAQIESEETQEEHQVKKGKK